MLLDSHAHLDLSAFDSDRDETIARARESGVGIIVNVGVDIESSRASLRLAERYPQIFAAIGFHPYNTAKLSEADLAELETLCHHEKVVAIGEIGLDFHRDFPPQEAQIEAFNRQLHLAREHNLPVVIHSRSAKDEVLDILTNWAQGQMGQPFGVLHCFSGSAALAQQYLELGFLLSIAGYITYPSHRAVKMTRSLPLDGFLVETDSPLLTPNPQRPRRNEPAFLPLIVNRIAEIKGIAPESIAQATTQNAIRLFRLRKESVADYLRTD